MKHLQLEKGKIAVFDKGWNHSCGCQRKWEISQNDWTTENNILGQWKQTLLRVYYQSEWYERFTHCINLQETLANWTAIQAIKTKFPTQVLPWRQWKCYKNTDLVHPHRQPITHSYTQEN